MTGSTSFLTLAKSGDTSNQSNWRPIALLNVSYKIFPRTAYDRIKAVLHSQQSEEQFGFLWSRSTTDALIVAESVVSKSREFDAELWVVGVGLRKALGCVEHRPLFAALRSQGLGDGYCRLLS